MSLPVSEGRRLRVLHVIANLDPHHGGPPAAITGMCLALARRGHTVTIATTDDYEGGHSHQPGEALGEEVAVQYFPIQWPRRYGLSLPMVEGLRRLIPDFDLVHIHSLYLFHTLVTGHWCRALGVPYVVRPHGTLDPYLRRRSRLKKTVYNWLVERRNLDHAAAVHYTSADERDLVALLGFKAPAVVVPLGIDLREFDDLPQPGMFRRRHPALLDKTLIVFLGRLTPKKGLDLLAKAFGEVRRVVPQAHLVIAGPDDEGYGRQVRKFLADSGVDGHTTLLGMVAGREKLELLRDTDVWVLPSYTENFGLAVVEAMASGLPLVISNRVNIWNHIAAREAGLVVDCDASQVSQAICRVLREPDLGRRLAANALSLARTEFSWAAVGAQLEQVYYDLLQPPVLSHAPVYAL